MNSATLKPMGMPLPATQLRQLQTNKTHRNFTPIQGRRSSVTITAAVRPSETSDKALERRLAESEAVSDRVNHITTVAELDQQIAAAGNKLLVIEVSSDEACQLDAQHSLAASACANLKHSFQRTARDCPDSVFLEVLVDGEEGEDLLDTLGIEVVPTLQFVQNGKLLWEHRGVTNIDTDLAEGMLFFGDTAAGGAKASDFITNLHSKAELEAWENSLGDKVLGVLDVSVNGAASCVHIYPAVLVMARQFQGFASFARIIGDENEETKAIMKELKVTQAPTFFFYRKTEVVGQHVGVSRSDLIAAILSKQAELGLTPPPPAEGRRERRKHAAEDTKAAKKAVKPKRWNSIF